MKTMQRRELETAAANYSYLRGLLYIPLGALFVLAALGNWQVGPLRHRGSSSSSRWPRGLSAWPSTATTTSNYGRLTPATRQQVRAGVAARPRASR